MLADRFLCEPDVSVRMALLLALADCVLQAANQPWIGPTVAHVLETYRNDPDPGIHAAARLLLHRAGRFRDVRRIDDAMDGAGRRGQGRWYVDDGNTMVVIDPIGRDPAYFRRAVDRPGLRDLEHGNYAGAVPPFPSQPPFSKEAGDKPRLTRGSRKLVRRCRLLRVAR